MLSILISIFLGKRHGAHGRHRGPTTREMSQMRCFVRRPAVASVTLVVVVAGLAAGGCGSAASPAAAGCLPKGGAKGKLPATAG